MGKASKLWTAEEKGLLVALVNAGHGPDAILKAMRTAGYDRSFGAITSMISKERDEGQLQITEYARRISSKPRTAAMRRCLLCSKEFKSIGPGNRVCPRCKCGEEWRGIALA